MAFMCTGTGRAGVDCFLLSPELVQMLIKCVRNWIVFCPAVS